MYTLENINTLINLSLALTKVNDQVYERSIFFVSVLTFVNSINFLYITFSFLFLESKLLEIGSPYYLGHAFFDFTAIFVYFIIILIYGSKANDIDI